MGNSRCYVCMNELQHTVSFISCVSLHIDSPLLCSVHLINGGITVKGSQVTVEFTGMGPIKYYKCSLDSNRPRLCKWMILSKCLHEFLYYHHHYCR